ncbi:hypothetical protein L873DRAFT_1790832 [Choiromyces venosus 120613-1]|uniref:Uncharacterized protein n=1 Tax=Choiromyces venosus 120613-1 TaxID=1336337 RepID=A0A3N4JHI2_9PEZI|nr:hypothetical protein L873DRAFT_1790832 [Choiromyces venosus 120613-1]
MVFKHNFSFSPRQPTLSRSSSRSSLASSHAGGLRNPDDGEVSPSSKGPSFMSPWGSKRSSVSSFVSSFRRRHQEAPTASSTDDDEGPEGEIALSRDSVTAVPTISVGDCGEEDAQNRFNGQDGIQKDIGIGLSTSLGPLDRTTIDISFDSTHKETPQTLPAEIGPEKPLTFATLHAPFPLFQPITGPKIIRFNRRPAILSIQIPPPPPSSYTIQRNQISTSELDDSPLRLKKSKGAERIGVQLLLKTLSPDSDNDEGANDNTTLGHNNTGYLEEPTPVYLSSPWFPPTQRKSITSEELIMESNPQSRRPSIKIQPSAKLETPPSPVVSPSSKRTSGSSALFRSYLGVPSASHTPRPSTPSSPRSFLLEDDDNDEDENQEVAKEEQPISRRGSLSPSSRRSSINTFFCRGSRTSFSGASNRWSIGLGSIADADIVIKDDEDLTGYPGIDELKKQISWLCTSPPEHSSPPSDDEGDDEDHVDSESEEGESYHKHLTLITKMTSRSPRSKFGSAGLMTPELVSSISDSSSGPVSTPPRRNRRRTASSECIVLEALQEMNLAGMKAELELPPPIMKGLRISGEVEIRGDGPWSEVFLDLEDESKW